MNELVIVRIERAPTSPVVEHREIALSTFAPRVAIKRLRPLLRLASCRTFLHASAAGDAKLRGSAAG